MKWLVVNAGGAGHSVELTTGFVANLCRAVPHIDTLTPFPSQFNPEITNEGINYFVPFQNGDGNENSVGDRYTFIVDFLKRKNIDYDLIIFCTLDEILSLDGAILQNLKDQMKGVEVTGIYFSSSYWRIPSKRDWCRFRESKLKGVNIPVIFTPDPAIPKVSKNYGGALNFAWLPDFTTTESDQSSISLRNRIITKARNKIVIGLVGSLGKWKGIVELVDLIVANRKLTENFLFVISGELVPQTFADAEYERLQKNLAIIEGDIVYNSKKIATSRGFNAVMKDFDILYCNYNNPQASGIVSKSVLMKKQVIGPGHGFVGEFLEIFDRFNAGMDLSSNASDTQLEWYKKTDPATRFKGVDKGLYDGYAMLLNPAVSADIFITKLLENRLQSAFRVGRGIVSQYDANEYMHYYKRVTDLFKANN